MFSLRNLGGEEAVLVGTNRPSDFGCPTVLTKTQPSRLWQMDCRTRVPFSGTRSVRVWAINVLSQSEADFSKAYIFGQMQHPASVPSLSEVGSKNKSDATELVANSIAKFSSAPFRHDGNRHGSPRVRRGSGFHRERRLRAAAQQVPCRRGACCKRELYGRHRYDGIE